MQFDHHIVSPEELALTSDVDFVVPLKQVGLITRAVLGAIRLYYKPRRIYVITALEETKILKHLVKIWKCGPVTCIPEETFFEANFNLNLEKIRAYYDFNRSGNQREPGWWYQQLIKFGAATQIKDLSFIYVVWDGDLVPTRRWKLCELKTAVEIEVENKQAVNKSLLLIRENETEKENISDPPSAVATNVTKSIDPTNSNNSFTNTTKPSITTTTASINEKSQYTNNRKWYFAILQKESRSEFNTTQYAQCMKSLTGMTAQDPDLVILPTTENNNNNKNDSAIDGVKSNDDLFNNTRSNCSGNDNINNTNNNSNSPTSNKSGGGSGGCGTFVSHHMVFRKDYILELLSLIQTTTKCPLPWPIIIMAHSRKFYRFSEYKTYSTYMTLHHPGEFYYHPYTEYGIGGLRYREANNIVENLLATYRFSDGGLTYQQIREYFFSESYTQYLLLHQQSQQQSQSQSQDQQSSLAVVEINSPIVSLLPVTKISAPTTTHIPTTTTITTLNTTALNTTAITKPAFVLLDHVYGLDGVDLNLSGPIAASREHFSLRVFSQLKLKEIKNMSDVRSYLLNSNGTNDVSNNGNNSNNNSSINKADYMNNNNSISNVDGSIAGSSSDVQIKNNDNIRHSRNKSNRTDDGSFQLFHKPMNMTVLKTITLPSTPTSSSSSAVSKSNAATDMIYKDKNTNNSLNHEGYNNSNDISDNDDNNNNEQQQQQQQHLYTGQSVDDSAIQRMTLGVLMKSSFSSKYSNQTGPRRPNEKKYFIGSSRNNNNSNRDRSVSDVSSYSSNGGGGSGTDSSSSGYANLVNDSNNTTTTRTRLASIFEPPPKTTSTLSPVDQRLTPPRSLVLPLSSGNTTTTTTTTLINSASNNLAADTNIPPLQSASSEQQQHQSHLYNSSSSSAYSSTSVFAAAASLSSSSSSSVLPLVHSTPVVDVLPPDNNNTDSSNGGVVINNCIIDNCDNNNIADHNNFTNNNTNNNDNDNSYKIISNATNNNSSTKGNKLQLQELTPLAITATYFSQSSLSSSSLQSDCFHKPMNMTVLKTKTSPLIIPIRTSAVDDNNNNNNNNTSSISNNNNNNNNNTSNIGTENIINNHLKYSNRQYINNGGQSVDDSVIQRMTLGALYHMTMYHRQNMDIQNVGGNNIYHTDNNKNAIKIQNANDTTTNDKNNNNSNDSTTSNIWKINSSDAMNNMKFNYNTTPRRPIVGGYRYYMATGAGMVTRDTTTSYIHSNNNSYNNIDANDCYNLKNMFQQTVDNNNIGGDNDSSNTSIFTSKRVSVITTATAPTATAVVS